MIMMMMMMETNSGFQFLIKYRVALVSLIGNQPKNINRIRLRHMSNHMMTSGITTVPISHFSSYGKLYSPLAPRRKGNEFAVCLVGVTRSYCMTKDGNIGSKTESLPGPSAKSKNSLLSTLNGDGVNVFYFRGLPQITVPLPSRREKCRFILKPLTNSVGDLLQMIQNEDKGIDHIVVTSEDGVRVAASNTIEMLMEQNFNLIINNLSYQVIVPPQEKPSQEELERLSSVRNLVGQLYAALNVDEHQLKQEHEMLSELEKFRLELSPMEEKKEQLDQVCTKRTSLLTWAGLGLMSVQFGILARLTWWEYSWDIMEPVTYFVTYGTTMLIYAYFVLTKQDYVLPDVRDRQHLITFHKNAKKIGLDVEKYNKLKYKVAQIEKDLKRLRDPLSLHLPLKTKAVTSSSKFYNSSTSIVTKAQQKIQQMLKRTQEPS